VVLVESLEAVEDYCTVGSELGVLDRLLSTAIGKKSLGLGTATARVTAQCLHVMDVYNAIVI
jgi:hypothetical protein